MKEQITIHSQSAPGYPKPEWGGSVEYSPKSIYIKDKNWRMLVEEYPDGYHVYSRFISRDPLQEIEHPMLFLKKIRGNSYQTFRKITKDSYEMHVFFMHHFFLNRHDLSK